MLNFIKISFSIIELYIVIDKALEPRAYFTKIWQRAPKQSEYYGINNVRK